MAGVMINGNRRELVYANDDELKRTLRQLKAYHTPSDPFHKMAKEELAFSGMPLMF